MTRSSARVPAPTLVGISVFWLALSVLFDGVTVLVLPALLGASVAEGAQATVLGIATFAGLLAAMLVQPLAGALSDRLRGRIGRRGFLMGASVGIGAGLALLALAAGSASAPTAVLMAISAYALLQVAGSAAQAAQQGFIPDLVPAAQRGRAAGLKSALDVGGAFLAFVLLGALMAGGGITLAVAGIAVLVIVTLGLTLILVREPRLRRSVDEGPAVAGRPGDRRRFLRLVIARFLFLLGTFLVGRFFLLYVADRLGVDPLAAATEAGAVLAALTLTTVLGALPAGWLADRLGRERLMVVGGLLAGAGCLLLALAADIGAILGFGLLLSAGSAAFAPANWAATADTVPPAQAARYMGLANIGTAGAAAVAGLAGPLIDLVDRARPGSGFAAVFAVAAACSVASALVARRIGHEPLGAAHRPASSRLAEEHPTTSGGTP